MCVYVLDIVNGVTHVEEGWTGILVKYLDTLAALCGLYNKPLFFITFNISERGVSRTGYKGLKSSVGMETCILLLRKTNSKYVTQLKCSS